MREFLKGWRRKVGCAALLMALAVMVAWIRSYATEEELSVPHRASLYVICSIQGHVCFEHHSDHLLSATRWQQMDLTPISSVNVLSFKYSGMHLDWERVVWGFNFGTGTETLFDESYDSNVPMSQEDIDKLRKDRFSFLVVPYWTVILPLVLISAFLILWKPRKKPQDEPSSSALTPKPIHA